ncbi:MAG: tryptophan-rich sensory protein [Elainella sp.]
MRQSISSAWSWLTLAAIITTFVVNIWSNIAPPNGRTIGEISNTTFSEVLITPANYAFAIWGVIYIGLLAFGLYQLQPEQRPNPRIQQTRPWLILACLAQAVWVFFFLSDQFWLSVLAMLTILVPLIQVYRRLQIGRLTPVTRQERWAVQVPFGVYLGWISVATVTNAALALYSQNWSGWGISPQTWTILMIGVAAVLGVLMILTRREIAYPLVISWALIAIAVKRAGMPEIAIPALVWALVLAGTALLPLRASLQKR